jgi:hypothetical protein
MLELTNRRDPQSVDELDAVGREQLRICGQRWDGDDLPPEARRSPTDDVDEVANFYLQMLACWDVLEGGVHAYDAWFYAVDSGLVFRAGTTEVVCSVVQFDFQSEDAGLATALAAAAKRVSAI